MLERLKIAGIRSFPPESEITIDFDKRVTLITGHNGAGKTTIIECLKAVTSGDFPPGSEKGKLFITDPSFLNTSEVSASIKLKFESVQNQCIQIGRFFKLSKTEGRVTLTKPENIIRFNDSDRNPTEKNLRIHEMNKVVPEYLGVSSSVLQYVTFCHQDDSMWPFAEPSTLKNVLDELFATHEFSKAMETQRKIVKKQQEELKNKKSQMKWVEEKVTKNRELVQKKKSLKEELKSAIEEKEQKTYELNNLAKQKIDAQRLNNLENMRLVKLEELKQVETSFSFLKPPENIESEKLLFQELNEKKESLEKDLELVWNEFEASREEKISLGLKLESIDQELLDSHEEWEKYKKGIEDIESENAVYGTCILEEKANLAIEATELTSLERNTKLKHDEKLNEIRKEITINEIELQNLLSKAQSLEKKTKCCESGEVDEQRTLLARNFENYENFKLILEKEEVNLLKEIEGVYNEISHCEEKREEFFIFKQREKLKLTLEEILSTIEDTEILQYLYHLNFNDSTQYVRNLIEEIQTQKESLKEKLTVIQFQITKSLEEKYNLESKVEEMQKSLVCTVSIEEVENSEKELIELKKLHRDLFMKDLTKREMLKEAMETEVCPICESSATHLDTGILKKWKEVHSRENCEVLLEIEKLEKFIESKKSETEILKNIDSFNRNLQSLNTELMDLDVEKEICEKELYEIVNTEKNCDYLLRLLKEIPESFIEFRIEELEAVRLEENNFIEDPFEVLQTLILKKNELENKLSETKEKISNNLTLLSNSYLEFNKISAGPTLKELKNELAETEKMIEEIENHLATEREKYQNETLIIAEEEEKIAETLKRNQSLFMSIQKLENLNEFLYSLEKKINNFTTQKAVIEKLYLKSQEKLHTLGLEEKETKLEEINNKLGKMIQISSAIEEEKIYQDLSLKIASIKQEIYDLEFSLKMYQPNLLEELQEQELKLSVEIGVFSGIISSKTTEKLSVSEQIDTTIDRKANELYIEIIVFSKACQEQTILLSALETSILEYHASKLTLINQLLQRFWELAYKGRDIHRIFIKAEEETRQDMTSYSYKLCFENASKSLSMRGRCSAGQRMLASILIRVALAEAFSEGRIILVLDEPTTNLDEENAEGLSEALIKLSNSHENLQLIVITHDETFSNRVMRESYYGSYFNVEKINGFSVANRTSNRF